MEDQLLGFGFYDKVVDNNTECIVNNKPDSVVHNNTQLTAYKF